jgi:hypothetical protein
LKTNKFDIHDDNATVVILNGPSQHDHNSDDEMIQLDAFREAVKQRVREDPSRPIKRAYDATASSASRGGYLRLNRHSIPDFHRVRTSVSRAKQEEVPRIPRALNDVNIAGVWAETWNGDNFLAHADNAWGVVIFATAENLTVLQQCRDLYIDGTFRTVPRPYYQYVTIHGTFHGRVIPFVSCLLAGITVGHYRQLLQTLKTKVRHVTGHALKPKRIMCDFELAIMSAVETELPRTEICGCLFHFRQSLYRKLNELGLSRAYKHDVDFRATIAKFMSIGFLPLQLVRNNFIILSTSRPFTRLARQYPDLNRFVAYVDNTYIRGRFPPRMWNMYMRNRRTRTTNCVEGKQTPLFMLTQLRLIVNVASSL